MFLIEMPYTNTIQEEGKCKKFYIDKRNDFLLISIAEGHFLPLSENVYDRLLNREVPNKRNENEAEWLSQTFAVYDFRNKIFYLSNSNKKADIKALFGIILKGREKTPVEILNIYKNVDDFIKEWKRYGSDIKYHVLLPLMPSGRSSKGLDEGVFEYLEEKILEENVTNVAFGAHFCKYLENSRIPTYLYPPESLSKNVILTKDKVQITPSSFNLNPIKTIEL